MTTHWVVRVPQIQDLDTGPYIPRTDELDGADTKLTVSPRKVIPSRTTTVQRYIADASVDRFEDAREEARDGKDRWLVNVIRPTKITR